MSYVVKRCSICNKTYNVHKDGKVKGACEHVKIGRMRGKKVFLATVDTKELDSMIAGEYEKSKK